MIKINFDHYKRNLLLDKGYYAFFKKHLIKEYVAKYGEAHEADKFISVNIRIYEKKVVKSRFKQHVEFSHSRTDLIAFADFVIKSLKDVAYVEPQQVVNIGIAKMVDSYKHIEVEIIEL